MPIFDMKKKSGFTKYRKSGSKSEPMRQYRELQTQEEQLKRLQINAESMSRSRSLETSDQQLDRRRMDAASTSKSRSVQTPEWQENRRRKDAAARSKSRSIQTAEWQQNRRTNDAAARSKSRSIQTAEWQENRRKNDAAARSKSRSIQTAEWQENRRKNDAARSKSRSIQTAEWQENRRKNDAAARSKSRSIQTAEWQENRRKNDAAARSKSRSIQTAEWQENRRKNDAAARSKSRSIQIAEWQENRRKNDAAARSKSRSIQSAEWQENRRKKDAAARSKCRLLSTPLTKQHRRASDSAHKVMRKLDSSTWVRLSNNDTDGGPVSDKPNCVRRLDIDFEDDMPEFPTEGSSTMHAELQADLDRWNSGQCACCVCLEEWPTYAIDKNGMCRRCYNYSRTGKPNPFGPRNNAHPGEPPDELKGLTHLEELLIAQAHVQMNVYHVKHGRYGYKGNTITFPQDIYEFCTKLPHNVNNLSILMVRRHGLNGTHTDFKVRRQAVLNALIWLKNNNPYYADIEIDQEHINLLPEDDFVDVPEQVEVVTAETDNAHGTKDGFDSSSCSFEEMQRSRLSGTFMPLQAQVESETTVIQNEIDTILDIDKPLDWPTINKKRPINERREVGYSARIFPTLFPYGRGDPNDDRPVPITFQAYCKHLLKLKGGHFMRHPRFPYFALNSVFRRMAQTKGSIYVKQNPEDARMTADDLKKLSKQELRNLTNKIYRYASAFRGCSAFWSKCRTDVMAMVDQHPKPPTVFFTASSADTLWPLRDYFRANPNSTSNVADLVRQNPAICDAYFTRRFELLLRRVLKEMGVEDYWYRVEFQHRGSIHIHGFLWFADAPDMKKLMRGENVDDDELNVIAAYFDKLICCRNPSINSGGDLEIRMAPSVNPCSRNMRDIDDYLEDYKDLIFSCQRHTRCGDYCLRLDKTTNKMKCRFDFPRDLVEKTKIVKIDPDTEETDTSKTKYSYKIIMARNDPLVNNHNRVITQSHRANTDIQAIVDLKQLFEYLIKYITKKEPRSETLIDVCQALIERRQGLERPVAKIPTSLLMRVAGDRDYGDQETNHLLLGMPLYGSSRTFVRINLDGGREITAEDEDTITKRNLIDRYMDRPSADKKMSLFNFWRRYDFRNKKFVLRRVEAIVITFPKLVEKPDDPQRELFCKRFLPRNKSFVRFEDLLGSHATYQSAYTEFLDEFVVEPPLSDLTYASLPQETPRNERSNDNDGVEDDEDNTPELEQDDWMLILAGRDLDFSHDSDIDWNQTAGQYDDVDRTSSFIVDKKLGWTKPSTVYDVDVNAMNLQQRRIYDMVKGKIESRWANQLLLIVSGTAGTGKSFCINQCRALLNDQGMIMAPTGVAAFNVNGKTLHSSLQLPIGKQQFDELKGERLLRLQREFQDVRCIIIDEKSMVGKRTFGMFDQRLRQAFPESSALFFGGCSVILVGDFGQLPPVKDQPLYSKKSSTDPLSIYGHLAYQQFQTAVVLHEIVRQAGDHIFCKLLQRLRDGNTSDSDFELLRTRFQGRRGVCSRDFDGATRIFTTNDEVSSENKEELDIISDPLAIIKASHNGGKKAVDASADEAGGLAHTIALKVGARVMLTSNVWQEVGLCNGSCGNIVDIVYKSGAPPNLPTFVLCHFDSYIGPECILGAPKSVPIVPLERRFYVQNTECSRRQVPLTLAWAITVHKSQSSTLDKAVINLGKKDFATGLAFVALSRARQLSDIMFHRFERRRLEFRTGVREDRLAEDRRLVALDGNVQPVSNDTAPNLYGNTVDTGKKLSGSKRRSTTLNTFLIPKKPKLNVPSARVKSKVDYVRKAASVFDPSNQSKSVFLSQQDKNSEASCVAYNIQNLILNKWFNIPTEMPGPFDFSPLTVSGIHDIVERLNYHSQCFDSEAILPYGDARSVSYLDCLLIRHAIVRGDGNCFYRSVCLAVFGCDSIDNIKRLRKLLVETCKNHAFLLQFYPNHNIDHWKRWSNDPKWGTEREIYATAYVMQRSIYVLFVDADNTKKCVWNHFVIPALNSNNPLDGTVSDEKIYLLNYSNEHFDLIVDFEKRLLSG